MADVEGESLLTRSWWKRDGVCGVRSDERSYGEDQEAFAYRVSDMEEECSLTIGVKRDEFMGEV